MTTNLEDFKKIIRDSLESRGVLQNLQSNLRSEIFKSLHENQQNDQEKVCQENLVINELIREYLEYNKYSNSLSVFSLESRTSKTGTLSREIVKSQLNIAESQNSQKLPLLYGIVSMLEHGRGSEYLGTRLASEQAYSDNGESQTGYYQGGDYQSGGDYNEYEQEYYDDAVGLVESLPASSPRDGPGADIGGGSSGRQSEVDGVRSASMGMYSANDFEYYSSADDDGADGSRLYDGSAPVEAGFAGDEDPNDYSDSVNVMAIEDLIS